MFSQNQVIFLSEIIAQYDYYVAYYYGNYYDYQVGETRDSKIILIGSDELPVVENGVYTFSDCSYYEITSSKYIMMVDHSVKSFSPLGSSDIVYSNVIDGAPQLDYIHSTIRTDAPKYILYGVVGFFALAVLIRVIFGGK